MWQYNNLKRDIHDLRSEVLDLKFRLWSLENPPKFNIGDLVKRDNDNFYYIIHGVDTAEYVDGIQRTYLLDSLVPWYKPFNCREDKLYKVTVI